MTRPGEYLAALFLIVPPILGCATAKPCPPAPPPQVITVSVPVVQSVPAPPVIAPPDLQLPALSAAGAPIDVLLLAVLHDLDEWKRVAEQTTVALEAYRVQSPKP